MAMLVAVQELTVGAHRPDQIRRHQLGAESSKQISCSPQILLGTFNIQGYKKGLARPWFEYD